MRLAGPAADPGTAADLANESVRWTCDPDAGASCYRFPAATNLTAPTGTTPIPLMAMFSGFGPAAVGAPAQQQIVGIQWQANSAPPADPDGGSQLGCTAVLRLDDIKFIP